MNMKRMRGIIDPISIGLILVALGGLGAANYVAQNPEQSASQVQQVNHSQAVKSNETE
ncbi:hypothetical protein [Candidatus Venteria ishoeyi]|uniref:Uncharacterized protein n=1 Tax=Candidatus Venteria ishoeyi TaxID=1899563 RepID=A0A1H6F4N5_9GAMM|nr:hypothetical protein [Candidatus Venteria ishoeyi]MDM8548207.1 hypothetical protein [Candidatus Venteria ishoeyi]SEH04341.1 Uncharacterised protein [Candidatus Venteria ishoeyi]